MEAFIKLVFDFSRIDDSLIDFGLVKCVFDALLDLFCEHGLDIFTDKLTVDSVAVGDGEEVGTAVLAKMRKHQEAVLVDFVRILRAETGLGRKCKLCNAIIKFLVGLPWLHCVLRSGRDLFRDACSDVLTLIIRRLAFITGFVLPRQLRL